MQVSDLTRSAARLWSSGGKELNVSCYNIVHRPDQVDRALMNQPMNGATFLQDAFHSLQDIASQSGY